MTVFASAGFFLALAAAIFSCKSSTSKQADHDSTTTWASAPTPTTQPIGSHWVTDKQLRSLMAELSKKNPNWPSNMPQEPESLTKPKDEDFDQMARAANSLMLAAEQLPKVAEKLQMNEADREGFLAQARVLRDQAGRLRDAAKKHNIEQMQNNMHWLNSTCLSCHSRYRDFSGQLDSTRASASSGSNTRTQ
jgi:hypothetical protein